MASRQDEGDADPAEAEAGFKAINHAFSTQATRIGARITTPVASATPTSRHEE